MSARSVMQLISTDGVYGAERVVLDLATYFARQSWDSRVVAIDCPGADALLGLAEKAGLRTHKLLAARRPLWSTLGDLRNYIAREEIDVVHAHGYKADTLLQWASIPRAVRKVSTCHTWYSDSWRMKLYEYLDKRALRHFDQVVVVSPQLQSEVLACGVRAERISLIRNGTAAAVASADARQRIRAEFGYAADDFVAIRIGRLAASKGNDILLRSLAGNRAVAGVKVLFVGDGEEREALGNLVEQLHLESQVVFAGYRADIPDLLAASDLFVLPSLKEGLPIALLEAMSAKLPIVSTDAGAITIALEQGRNAWVVPAGNLEAFAAALVAAHAHPELRSAYAEASHEDFQRSFSQEAMGASYLGVYQGGCATAAASDCVVQFSK